MTLNLQIILAVIGVVVVIMVYLISRWQNRMWRPAEKSAHPESHSGYREAGTDAAMPGDFDTPPWVEARRHFADPDGDSDEDEAVATETPDNGDSIPEFTPETTRSADAPTIAPSSADARTPVFDSDSDPDRASETAPAGFLNRRVEGFEQLSQIDYWVKITGERDVGRETVLALYRNADFSKARGIHGFKVPDQVWCNVENEAEDSRFTDLVATIQLADHNGAIGEREMTRFSALVAKLSAGTGREFVFMAPVENALAQADAIAEFARHFDSIFVVNIRPQDAEGFHGPAIDRYALQMGMERDGNYYSRFKSVGKGKVTLYSLADLSDTGCFDFDNMQSFSTSGLTFFTKPAVNRSPGAVFAEMADTAKAFASRIKGEVNSPNHDDLSKEEVEAIRKSIEQVAAEMEQLGIPAGSDEAARIF